jgi:hypothetical protein
LNRDSFVWQATEAAAAVARLAAARAEVAGAARQQAVWSLTQHVRDLEQQLSNTVDVEALAALEPALAAATAQALAAAEARVEVG